MKAIHRRQRFKDPRCHKCAMGECKYEFRPVGHKDRLRICAICKKCNGFIKSFARNAVPARIKLALMPGSVANEIRYPKHPSEFEIQSFLYTELRRLGYDARGEVSTRDCDCRFDIVIFRHSKPVAVIEVKESARTYRSRQIEQYRAYGIRVICVCGREQAENLIRKASSRASASLPILVGVSRPPKRRKFPASGQATRQRMSGDDFNAPGPSRSRMQTTPAQLPKH